MSGASEARDTSYYAYVNIVGGALWTPTKTQMRPLPLDPYCIVNRTQSRQTSWRFVGHEHFYNEEKVVAKHGTPIEPNPVGQPMALSSGGPVVVGGGVSFVGCATDEGVLSGADWNFGLTGGYDFRAPNIHADGLDDGSGRRYPRVVSDYADCAVHDFPI